jgi:formate dehydrogenase subunit gamma
MSEMVRKSSTGEIINHWILAVSCILLIITGYGFLFQLKPIGNLFGGFNTMKGTTGVGSSLPCLLYRSHYLRESGLRSMTAVIAGGGIVAQGERAAHGNTIPVRSSTIWQSRRGIAIAASGSPSGFCPTIGIRIASHLVHNLPSACSSLRCRCMYLGTLANPGTFRIMVYGTVPVEFAKKRYPKWMKEIGKA